MRVIFMAKDKHSARDALDHLLSINVEIAAVIANPENKDKNSLWNKAIELGIPALTDIELYKYICCKEGNEQYPGFIENIDVVISFLFWKKIRKPIINLARIGCINFHPAPLPEYRGVGGYNFAILDELDYWGISAHFVDENIDTGEIIKVERFYINHKQETAYSLSKKTQQKLLDLFKLVISDVNSNKPLDRQVQGEGRYIDKVELEKAKQITLADDINEINKKIRAFWFPPYDGAYIKIHDKKFTLIDDSLLVEISNELDGK